MCPPMTRPRCSPASTPVPQNQYRELHEADIDNANGTFFLRRASINSDGAAAASAALASSAGRSATSTHGRVETTGRRSVSAEPGSPKSGRGSNGSAASQGVGCFLPPGRTAGGSEQKGEGAARKPEAADRAADDAVRHGREGVDLTSSPGTPATEARGAASAGRRQGRPTGMANSPSSSAAAGRADDASASKEQASPAPSADKKKRSSVSWGAPKHRFRLYSQHLFQAYHDLTARSPKTQVVCLYQFCLSGGFANFISLKRYQQYFGTHMWPMFVILSRECKGSKIGCEMGTKWHGL